MNAPVLRNRICGNGALLIIGFALEVGCVPDDHAGNPSERGADVSTITGRLWILDESGTCTSTLSNFFPCLLANTNFNAFVSAFSTGDSLSWGGIVTGNGGCSYAANDTCSPPATGVTWQGQLQCAEKFAKFPLRNNDVMLVVQHDTTQWGCNNSTTYSVQLPDGTFASVRGAFIGGAAGKYWNGGTRACGAQTTLGLHEVYEAATDGISADCCLGEQWICAAGPVLTQLTCGTTTYDVQKLSPYGYDRDKSKCTGLAMTCVPSQTDSYYCALYTKQYGQETCGNHTWTNDCGTYVNCGACPSGESCASNGFCVPLPPTCPTSSNWLGAGQYCWNATGMSNGIANHLYYCSTSGGAASDLGNCTEGCHGMPAGQNDICYYAYCPSSGSGCFYGSGLYCGRACGMSNANPDIVYYCAFAGAKASINTVCSGLCTVAPPGYNDHC